jgi:hypothetical protein
MTESTGELLAATTSGIKNPMIIKKSNNSRDKVTQAPAFLKLLKLPAMYESLTCLKIKSPP